jgi:tRNA pseudouridine32 synthase/23S rRNA pseudouridine746 synthase
MTVRGASRVESEVSAPLACRYFPPPDEGLDLAYVDDHLLVVMKPAGLLSVPGRGEDKQDCLLSRVRGRYPDALIVHRLDMATSGLLVLARNDAAHRALSRMFALRQVQKRYVALLAGRLEHASGIVDLPLITDWPNRPRQKVDVDLGKPSLTRYRLLSYDRAADTSRVSLEPETGRSHQLRVHMQSLGHPILGDELYGSGAVASRLMLHAAALGFIHPMDQRPLSFVSEPEF